ncbi:MAG: diguanylate cyclase [Spirochaetae bacterium HGW-Spirochaetae-8]|nr:MAG: diguanylate cyclase [Spirochaetae bacterium HGW-Spirochaetae-8]
MIVDIIYNIALLLSLSIIYAISPIKGLGISFKSKVLMGVVIGIAGLLVMANPFLLVPGIVFDSRSILISVTGMFFGLVPTLVSSIMMAIYRIYLGGGGVYTGISVIAFSAIVGVLWHRFRLTSVVTKPKGRGLEFYLVSVVTHVGMLLCMLLMPKGFALDVIRAIYLPVLGIYPLGGYLLSMLLFNQRQRLQTIQQLAMSERRFKTMFEQAPLGMSLTDSATGRMLDVNAKFLTILGRSREQLLSTDWMNITHPDDLAQDQLQSARIAKGEIDSFSMDKRYIRPDGTPVWVNMAIATIQTQDSATRQHLCMVADISERKLAEERILYANTHDYLTDLHNRSHFEGYIRRMDRSENLPLSAVISDINGLKLINDAFGRKAGDELLRKVADIIRSKIRGCDYCARVGGDEIVLLLPRTTSAQAEVITKRIQEAVSQEKVYNIRGSISFGVETKYQLSEDINEIIKKAENDLNRRKLFESPSMRGKAIYTIINTLHEKNPREELHSQRVSALSVRIGEALGLSEKEINELRTIGLLHDIGKIAISESILNKEGRLDEDEWLEMKRHPEIGYRILSSVNDMSDLAEYVLAHHERLDGKGYPKGLAEGAIPLQSRIIAIADAYDAMTSERTYRAKLSDAEAIAELKRCAGTQFDTGLAQEFVEKVLHGEWNVEPPAASMAAPSVQSPE